MALFNFGKKKEKKNAPACCCGSTEPKIEENASFCCGSASQAEESISCCCGKSVDGICCIKVLGSGCKSCHALLEATKEAVKNMGLTIEVEYVTDMEKIMKYGAMSMPALVINEQIASMGKVLKAAEKNCFVSMRADMKKVAFICVHNSCRSQIAEALGKKIAGDVFESYSAGTEIKPQINQDAVRIMKGLYGIDMEQTQYSKLITDIPDPDIAISMGCNVGCPFIGRAFDDNWGVEDPTGKSDNDFLRIIKDIENKILQLRDELKTS